LFRNRRLAVVLAFGAASAIAQTPARPFASKTTKTEPLTMTGLGGAAPGVPAAFSPKITKTQALTMTGVGGAAPNVPGSFKARTVTTEKLTMTGAGK
jgi:hypothetical protein